MARVMENPHYDKILDKIQSLAAELNALWMQAGAAKIHNVCCLMTDASNDGAAFGLPRDRNRVFRIGRIADRISRQLPADYSIW